MGLFAGVIHGECLSSQLESSVCVEIHGECLSSQLESWARVERPLGQIDFYLVHLTNSTHTMVQHMALSTMK